METDRDGAVGVGAVEEVVVEDDTRKWGKWVEQEQTVARIGGRKDRSEDAVGGRGGGKNAGMGGPS